jgi:Transposase, Mutator family
LKRADAKRHDSHKPEPTQPAVPIVASGREIQLSLDRDELLGLMQDSLESWALKLGMLVASSLLEDEVTRLCGRRYERRPHRTHTRYGHQPGTATLAGQKIAIARPRVRSTDGGGEVPLETYARLQSPEAMPEAVLRRMARGVSTRDYANVIDLTPEGFGVQKSSVSRDFVRASAAQVKALAERRFDGMHFPVILIDGVDYPYAYCSPCHERYRSASPAPMPGQRTEVTNLRATGDQPLFMFPPFVRWRVAA